MFYADEFARIPLAGVRAFPIIIMDKFENKVLKFIRDNKLIQRGDKVTVGFSGGADSVCLFTVLHKLKRLLGISLQAVHVNHNLRGAEALRDEEFCIQFARELGEPIQTVSIDVRGYASMNGLTEEESGRILRYEALQIKAGEFAGRDNPKHDLRSKHEAKENAKEAGGPIRDFISYEGQPTEEAVGNKVNAQEIGGKGMQEEKEETALIAVAHHADDQAETVLLNLMRGSGLKGLAGMKAKRDNIIRPLLGVSRSDIIDYLERQNISYVDDSTNFENEHTRNRLRNIIIPELKASVNQAASEHIALSAAIIQDADEYIQEEARHYVDGLDNPETEDGIIKLKIKQNELKEKARILRRYVIIESLGRLNVPLKDWGEKHFSDIDEALFKNKGYHVDLPGQVYAENAYKETWLCVRKATI